MVTLSSLIVLASLFSQLSASLPDSPVPKAIETFFFYYIAKLSYVFICHTFLALLRFYRTEKEEEQKKLDDLFDYRPERPDFFHAPAKNFQARQGPKRKQILPFSPVKTPPAYYVPPQPTKYCLSMKAVDRICLYLGLALDAIYLLFFLAYVFTQRAYIFSQH